jgi:hypothetical protein
VPGFRKSATADEIASHGYVLTPGRYVGAEEAEDDGEPFEEKMARLVATLEEQFAESSRLKAQIREPAGAGVWRVTSLRPIVQARLHNWRFPVALRDWRYEKHLQWFTGMMSGRRQIRWWGGFAL